MEQSESRHYLFALLLGIAGLLIILLFITIRSQAAASGDADTSAGVNNANPSVTITGLLDSSQGLITTHTPSEGATNDILTIAGTITDLNGCQEVVYPSVNLLSSGGMDLGSSASAVLYKTSLAAGELCTSNYSNCYAVSADNTGSGGFTFEGCDSNGDTEMSFEAEFQTLSFNMDPTDNDAGDDWTAYVEINDMYGGQGTDTESFEVATVVALDLSNTSIAYGNLELGGISAEQSITVENLGNIDIDVLVEGTDMTCDVLGVIDFDQQKVAVTSGEGYANMTAIGFTAAPVTMELNLAESDDAEPITTDDLYFMLQLPASGIAGSCTGTNTLTAAASV